MMRSASPIVGRPTSMARRQAATKRLRPAWKKDSAFTLSTIRNRSAIALIAVYC